jgi:hypothetical protein
MNQSSSPPAAVRFRALVLALSVSATQTAVSACAEQVPDDVQSWPVSRPTPVEAVPAEHWFVTPEGWILAANRCAAVTAAGELRAAFEAHRDHFGPADSFGAIVAMEYATHAAAIRGAGADWVLPWRFGARVAPVGDDPRVAAIRAQVEAQLGAGRSPADPARVEALVQQTLQQLGGGSSTSEPQAGALEPKAIRHEVAHVLYLDQVWPSSKAAGEQYGGDAPDWLDETVAVAAESASMTADRRSSFRRAVVDGEVIPLEEFLSMTHPVFGGAAFADLIEQARSQARSGGPTVLSAKVDSADSARSLVFYAQARGFFDYLTSRIGDPGWLGDLSAALRDGRSFEDWLAARPGGEPLPTSLEALEADFLRWSAALAEES